jgi:hypothetical protein
LGKPFIEIEAQITQRHPQSHAIVLAAEGVMAFRRQRLAPLEGTGQCGPRVVETASKSIAIGDDEMTTTILSVSAAAGRQTAGGRGNLADEIGVIAAGEQRRGLRDIRSPPQLAHRDGELEARDAGPAHSITGRLRPASELHGSTGDLGL